MERESALVIFSWLSIWWSTHISSTHQVLEKVGLATKDQLHMLLSPLATARVTADCKSALSFVNGKIQ